MNHPRLSLAAVFILSSSAVSLALAGPKDYPMSGPIVSITDTTFVVQQAKTKENWEFARSPEMKGASDLKVGDRVTVRYTLLAISAEAKAAKPDKTPAATGAVSSSPVKAAGTAPAKP